MIDILDRRGVTPLKLGSDFVPTGHRVISAKLIKNGHLDLTADEARFVDATTYAKWMKSPLLADDVLLTSEAPLGEAAYVSRTLHWCLGQRLFGIRTRKERLHGRFLYYAFRSDDVAHDLQSRATGTTAQGIRQTELRRIAIPLPPLDEQKAIAAILGALDDKIELNRRMNETLEATARALFKSWFVDFHPVRAKSDGRQPYGMNAETASLFPSEFQDSDLGEIPKGWRVESVDSMVVALSGGTPSRADASMWAGNIPWISPKAMNEIHVDTSEEMVTREAIGNGTRLAPSGSTLVMVRGMGLHEKVRISQARCEVAFNQDVKALVPRDLGPTFLMLALLDAADDLLGKVESSGHGTGRLPSDLLLGHRVVVPTPEVQRRLAPVLDSMNDRIAVARQEARTLAATRDALLPKLLSGELRIKDAEKLVEAQV